MSLKKTFAAVVLSTSLVLGGSIAAMATETTSNPVSAPAVSPTPKAQPFKQYREALAVFRTEMTKFRADRITFAEAMKAHRTVNAAYYEARKAINTAFKAAVDPARATLRAALAAATTGEQKAAAYSAFRTAVTAATATRDAAVASLGAEPAKPVKPTKPVKPAKPERPTPAPTVSPN
jgi:hypothetical protein